MKFRIRHENLAAYIMFILAFILIAGSICVSGIMDVSESYLLLGFFLELVVILVFAVVQSMSTVVIIEDGAVTIKKFIAKKTINIDEISDIQISRYERWHKNHYIEQRMRMVISFYDKKDIVLNDTAMAHTSALGILASRYDVLPDEEVALYQVYQIIMSQMS